MFFGTYRLWLFLLLIGYCLVGFYYRQAKTDFPPMERVVSVTEETVSTREVVNLSAENVRHRSLLENDINTDFYQTIIKNNLFAPLGTVLNPTPKPGANLTLLATFLREAPAVSTALIENRTMGRQHTIAVGESIGDFQLIEVAEKNVTLSHNKEEIRLALSPIFFLNTQRR